MKEYKYTINGNKYEISIEGIEDNIAKVLVNGEEYKVEMEKEPEPEKKKVVVKPVTPQPAHATSSASASPRANANNAVKAPLPGVIVEVKVAVGDKVKIKVAPKGFGSENMSRVFMLKPADGIEGVKNAILTAVKDAGPNACPPMIVGVGVGGTFEKCALMAKEALTREVGSHSDIPWVKELEEEMLDKINRLGIGPGGLGGTTTALAVNVNTYPTHIAGLPVGINICCHVNRHIIREV